MQVNLDKLKLQKWKFIKALIIQRGYLNDLLIFPRNFISFF